MFGGFGPVNFASYVDPNQERPQPEPPTHVGLPNLVKQETPSIRDWNKETERPNLRRDFVTSRKVADITAKFYQDLNIDISTSLPIDQLVPRDSQGRPFLPSVDVDSPSVHAHAPHTQLSQGAFLCRLSELKHDNDIAYRTVTRAMLPKGVEKIKLSDFRTFFTALQSMSEHWETDLDDYFFLDDDGRSIHDEQGDSDFNEPEMMMDIQQPATEEDVDLPPSAPLTLNELVARDMYDSPPLTRVPSAGSDSSDDFLRELYRGRRTSCGSKMPWVYRMDVIKGFLEAAAFQFRCKVAQPRVHPTLILSGVRLPVNYQSFLVHRVPKQKEKRGMVEGPLMAAYVRKETENFDSGSDEERRDKARLDQLKEIGSLLHIAQERRRQGRQEKSWFKKTPAGGHWFSEMASDSKEVEDLDMSNLGELQDMFSFTMSKDGKNGKVGKEDAPQSVKKKKTSYQNWKAMEPQKAFWDPKTDYQAIGKDPESEWDEVYVLSSMYHHLSILKMRVHGAYLDFITDGRVPDPLPKDPSWCRPILQRSKWFDLFKIDDRVEAFQCLWGIMCYLTR